MAQPAQPAPGYDPASIAQVLQQAGLNYAPPQPVAAVAQAPTSDVNPPAVTTAPTQLGGQGLRMPAAPVAPVTEAGFGPQTTNVMQPGAAERPVEPVAVTPQTSNVANPAVAAPAMATSGQRNAADLNNPSGIGWNGQTWNTYDTPKAGVEDTQRLVSNYLTTPGRNTPEGFVGTWVTGDGSQGATVQNGAYAQAVRRNLSDAGVALNSDGTIPNTPEANAAITRAIIQHETAPDKQERFASLISTDPEVVQGGTLRGRTVASVGREMGMGEPGYGGGAQQPSRAPGVDRVIGMQGNIEQLAAYIGNPDNPKEARDAASLILKSRYKEDEMTRQGQKLVTDAIQNGDWKTLERLMKPTPRQKREEEDGITLGGIAKAFLFSAIGFQSGAQEVVEKMGVGAKWATTNIGDDEVNAKFRKDGSAIEGQYITGPKAGQALDSDELQAVSGGATGGKTKPDVSTQDVQKGDLKGRVVTSYGPGNKPTTYVESGGKKYKYDSSWTPVSISTSAAKAEQAAGIKLRYAGPTAYTEAGAKIAGETSARYGVNIGYQKQVPGAPLVDLNTGRPVTVDSNGVINVTQSGVPGAAPAPGGTPPVSGQTPAQLETGSAVDKLSQEQFVRTTIPAVTEQGNMGRDISTSRRQQISIIENNPSILDIYNGSGDAFDRGRNVITKLLTGVYNENNSGDFYKDLKQTGLDSNQRSAVEQMWNLTQGINGKTLKTNVGSGPVSNADMRTNQAANLQNFTETTPLGALQIINRSKFTGDLDAAKAAFIAKNPTLNSDAKFSSAWAKESSDYTRAYEGIAEARANFLKPFAPPRNATAAQLSVFRDKVFKSFEIYPVPAFDSGTNKWTYGTYDAEQAAAKKILGRK